MSLRLDRLWLVLGLFLASESFALGLGDIELHSALNEPLRAEIHLVSATPEELANLTVELASAETFERYGLYRPLYLTRLQFTVRPSGRAEGNVIEVRSADPVTEPFVTFLVEATWSSGRLLREYTVLLDPPTFAPPPVSEGAEAVTAPGRAPSADSGRIERSQPAPAAAAGQSRAAGPGTEASDSIDTATGEDVQVQRGDTLWGIAEQVRPDNRVTMNQTMVAIYEANPQAFAGNINRLTAGSTLRIPSADAIFNISRGDAMTEVRRQNAAIGLAESSTQTEPRLTLVPPDSSQEDYTGGVSRGSSSATGDAAANAATAERIEELETTIADQKSLLEIRDNELAQLRTELARLRGEAAVPAAGEPPDVGALAGEEPVEETDRVFADESTDTAATAAEDETAADREPAAGEETPAATTATPDRTAQAADEEPGLVDRIVAALTGFWGILGIVLIVVLGLLAWLAKRAVRGKDDDSTGVWGALDADADSETAASTERLRALARDDDSSIVVVEQETSPDRRKKSSAPVMPVTEDEAGDSELAAETGVQPSLEDTFSSDTAINLDQSDPVAEADFHMAYGLYDQAADLINGALAIEPERQDLMAKLCEIYFVWGNRDAFVDAANRLHDQLGGETTPDWDKIVIMGQQIAGDHKLFSGVSTAAATRAVDLSLDGSDEGGALDMDFAGGPDGEVSDVVDLGADDGRSDGDEELDFLFDDEGDDEGDAGGSTTREMANRDEATVESPTIESRASDNTAESPTLEQTLEQPIESLDSTSELPLIPDNGDDFASSADATAEIDLDDLGLDLHELAESGLATDFDDDVEAAAGDFSDLDSELESALDPDRESQRNEDAYGLDRDATVESGVLQSDVDLEATGRNSGFEDDGLETSPTGIHEGFDPDSLAATGEMPAADDATGKNPAASELELQNATDVDIDIDTSLLDATGRTQILSEDFPVETSGDTNESIADDDKTMLAPAFSEDAETMLASLDEDEGYEATTALPREELDFDFAKTEALPNDAFDGDSSADETGEVPGPAGGTDVDLDLDDLTAALRLSEGDTVDQPRDDATVERPRVDGGLIDLDVGEADDFRDETPTEALSSDEFSDDLHDARTMTEVGTKLDLARAYVDMGDPDGARSILDEVLDEGDEGQRQQAQRLLDSLPA